MDKAKDLDIRIMYDYLHTNLYYKLRFGGNMLTLNKSIVIYHKYETSYIIQIRNIGL